MPPPGSVTEVAVPGALMLTSVSGVPLLISARNTLADEPAGRLRPSGAPRTKTFLMAMLPAFSAAESVGGWNCSVGAFVPASQPARTGISAAVAAPANTSRRARTRRPGAPAQRLRITACSNREDSGRRRKA